MGELAFPDPALGDHIVALRAWVAADVPGNVMLFADPSVQRFSWPEERAYTEADAREYFAQQQRERREGTALSFAFTRPGEPDVVIGGGSLYAIEVSAGRAAVGYWLSPEWRGQGIATHATRLMATWAFAGLGIERLELTCGPDNRQSQAVAERCGFTREGVLRAHLPFKGRRRDTVMYSLLPTELR